MKMYWDLFIMILATWNCITIPITMAFEPPFANSDVVYILNGIIDIFFILDIFVNFRTTLLHPKTGVEIFIPR